MDYYISLQNIDSGEYYAIHNIYNWNQIQIS